MPAHRLSASSVHKPWGRRDLGLAFANFAGLDEPVGEIWFRSSAGEEPDLLIKYLFTSERLSVQVHRGNAAAIASGYRRGKDEAWLVLEAEPGATIGLGLKRNVSAQELRKAALDGSIVDLMHWRPVRAGDFLFCQAGTIHALGGGLKVLEIQQNLDLTYRLYDYGRPRELHLDEGLACARLDPTYAPRRYRLNGPPTPQAAFSVHELQAGASRVGLGHCDGWFLPLFGSGHIDGQPFQAGECWQLHGRSQIELSHCGSALLTTTLTSLENAPAKQSSA